MPSTRKQRNKERRSRKIDIMSDAENVDVMLRSYSRNDEMNEQSEIELSLNSESSRPQRNSNVTGEDFMSILTSSRENSELTIETTRMIKEEISNQMSMRLDDIKTSLNFQTKNAISTAITETVLPAIHNAFDMQGRDNFTMADRGSNGLEASRRELISP